MAFQWRRISVGSNSFPSEWINPGCYAVFGNGALLYIGQSQNVRQRLISHRIQPSWGGDIMTPWGHFDAVELAYKPSRRSGDWLMREWRLINRLRPLGNILHCNRGQRRSR